MMKRLIPKIFLSVMLLTDGVLWLVGSISEEFRFSFNAFWPILLIGIGLTFLLGAFCYKSLGYLYFFGLLASFGAIFLYSYYTPEGFASLKIYWPLLIGCPGISSFIMFFARKFSFQHLKFTLIFIGLSAALYIANVGIVGWGIMLPSAVVLLAVIILANVIFRKGVSWDIAENETEEEGASLGEEQASQDEHTTENQ